MKNKMSVAQIRFCTVFKKLTKTFYMCHNKFLLEVYGEAVVAEFFKTFALQSF